MKTQTLFRLGLNILFNVLPSPIYVLFVVQVLQSCKPICNLNLILFPNLWLIKLPQVKSLIIKPLCGLLTHSKSFPSLSNHQIIICITISSPKASHIQYTWMPSPIYQYVVNMVLILTIRGGPGVFMNVPVMDYRALNNQIFYVAKLTSLTPLSLLLWLRFSCQIVDLKIFSFSTFALKSPINIFIWYFRKWSNTCSNSSLKLSFDSSRHSYYNIVLQSFELFSVI